MRSVNVERKPRAKARNQTVRPSSRRELAAVQSGSARRDKNMGPMGRLAARLSLLVRRPIIALCSLLVILVLLAALLADFRSV